MSLWLNKVEKEYLICLIRDDMGEFPDGCETITVDKRDKLYEKLQQVKV